MTVSAMAGATTALIRCHRLGLGASGSAASRAMVSGESEVLRLARRPSQSTLLFKVAVSPVMMASRICSAVWTGQAA